LPSGTQPPAQPASSSTPPVAAMPSEARDKHVAPSREDKRPVSHGGGKPGREADMFESTKPAAVDKKPKTGGDDDVFENHGRSAGGEFSGTCSATISSKPWAEVSVDGKPTGKITPLVNYTLPCGKHRITFKNADLMIERNESITLKSGQPFKKIFSLVENEL
jgi:hypothetical protein